MPGYDHSLARSQQHSRRSAAPAFAGAGCATATPLRVVPTAAWHAEQDRKQAAYFHSTELHYAA
jgi:hypothetical protein